MPKRPRVALKVNDLASSLTFYVDWLGLQLVESQPNADDQAHWVEALAYNQRAIEPSLALIKATRWHLAHLFQHIHDHWDRYVLLKFATEEGEGHKVTVGQLLDGMNWHLADHCAEIRETRRIHSR